MRVLEMMNVNLRTLRMLAAASLLVLPLACAENASYSSCLVGASSQGAAVQAELLMRWNDDAQRYEGWFHPHLVSAALATDPAPFDVVAYVMTDTASPWLLVQNAESEPRDLEFYGSLPPGSDVAVELVGTIEGIGDVVLVGTR